MYLYIITEAAYNVSLHHNRGGLQCIIIYIITEAAYNVYLHHNRGGLQCIFKMLMLVTPFSSCGKTFSSLGAATVNAASAALPRVRGTTRALLCCCWRSAARYVCTRCRCVWCVLQAMCRRWGRVLTPTGRRRSGPLWGVSRGRWEW